VLSVEKGWQGRREVNRVGYRPEEVSIEQLEQWLKEADTFIRTLEPNKRNR